jgi:predicted glycogen debranching enzyme
VSGGFASSTVLLCPTRRYHGLLVSSFPGSDKRHVFVSRFDESVHSLSEAPIGSSGQSSFPLSIARYPGTWFPQGHKALESFELAPFPIFRYRIGEARITRAIQMLKGTPAVLVRYELEGGSDELELRARALIAFREADALTKENVDIEPEVTYLDSAKKTIRLRPYVGLPPAMLALEARDGAFDADPVWFRSIEYATDVQRGYEGREDNFSPGVYRVRLKPGESAYVCATLRECRASSRSCGARKRSARSERGSTSPTPRDRLAIGADDFLYRTRHGRLGAIAGFPWFGEWGRDTFVSLPGLLLARGRIAECGDALASATRFLRRGLMPNIFGASQETSHYGSVDAALWFARAVRLYQVAGGNADLIERRLQPALASIAEHYENGTELGITCDDGALIRAGHERLNATWMDASIDGQAVTPRDGCAVEINALWYSLLAHLEELAQMNGRPREEGAWRTRKERAGASFVQRFWLAEPRYLADVWKDGAADRRVRPNMVIAAALELSPLDAAQRAGVVERAELELLTPRGLRTLSPRDPGLHRALRRRSAGARRAYHQGTVWPWLVGFYCEALLRARGANAETAATLRKLLASFDSELDACGLNHVSEVYDGDPPHHPGGTIAQAWNTAELLRAWRMVDEASAP